MAGKVGRPKIDNPKNMRMEIRLTRDQAELLEQLAEELGISKTDVILKGIRAVSSLLARKKKKEA